MKMKIVALLAVLFIACSALHFVEPTSAASAKKGYLIDHGTTYFQDETDPKLYYKFTWKTYWYSNNKRTVKTIQYLKVNKKWKILATGTDTMYKISKTKIKHIDTNKYYPTKKTSKNVWYQKTKLNTRNYYWKVYRPGLKKFSPE
ncbi:MAG: hypothetical protein Q8R66_05890 [Methanobacteriaceae archaeon]|nr:hypothetical protein [Methanobacteriaceae archaeon]